MSNLVYLSLGSNLGDRDANLKTAIVRLGVLGEVVSVSAFYETEPVEVTQQPWFLNCAVGLRTEKEPGELMTAILEVERDMGRRRTQNKGPRTIDIDILLFGDLVVDAKELTVPHPAMKERRFVLAPLAEIAAEAWHPVFKQTVREMLSGLGTAQVVKKVTD